MSVYRVTELINTYRTTAVRGPQRFLPAGHGRWTVEVGRDERLVSAPGPNRVRARSRNGTDDHLDHTEGALDVRGHPGSLAFRVDDDGFLAGSKNAPTIETGSGLRFTYAGIVAGTRLIVPRSGGLRR